MFRTSDMVLIAVMVSAAAFTYKTKHEAENQLAHLRRIEAQIRLERETIDILKADWSLLTQPARLQRLVENYRDQLGLEPIDPYQFGNLADIPARPLDLDAAPAAASGGMAETDKTIVTGSTVE